MEVDAVEVEPEGTSPAKPDIAADTPDDIAYTDEPDLDHPDEAHPKPVDDPEADDTISADFAAWKHEHPQTPILDAWRQFNDDRAAA